VAAAVEAGLDRAGGEDQLTDEFLAVVVEKVRPHRLDGHGETWRLLEQHQEQIKVWLDDEDLTVAKVRDLLGRQGVVVPARTLERFAAEPCGPRLATFDSVGHRRVRLTGPYGCRVELDGRGRSPSEPRLEKSEFLPYQPEQPVRGGPLRRRPG
jgi:hypothetical protein